MEMRFFALDSSLWATEMGAYYDVDSVPAPFSGSGSFYILSSR